MTTFPQAPIDKRFSKPLREMICLYGATDCGKTHMALTVALWHQNLGSDAQFYVISTDQSYGPLLSNPEFENLDNIRVAEVADLQECINAARQWRSLTRPGDFILVDRIDHPWGWAADEYAGALARKEGTTIEDMGDLWRVEGVSGDYPIRGWDWGGINARYRAFRSTLLASRAHLIVMADERELLTGSQSGKTAESKEMVRTFSHVGVKPTGQKEDPSVWHTIINVQSKKPRTQQCVTAKEKHGRRRHLGTEMTNGQYKPEPVEDFFMDYLVGVGKWEMS